MRDSVARVDDHAGERPPAHLALGPAGREREDGLHGDIQPWDVERLEHDLGGVLSVLGGVEWWLRE